MKVLIITPGYLPVPAVRGGAVEGLVDTILQENEKAKKLKIDVVSIDDGIVAKTTLQKTRLNYVHNKTLLYKIERALRYVINLQHIHYFGNQYISEVCKIVKNNSYNAIIVENKPQYILPLRKVFPKTPVFLHLHNDYLNNSTPNANSILDKYTGVFTVSNYIADRVKGIGGNCRHIETVYNGIDISTFQRKISASERKMIREKYGLCDTDFVYLYVGRIIPAKGVLEMVRAFKSASKSNPKLQLLIIGSANFEGAKMTKYAKQTIEEAKDCQNIHFTGYIDHDQIAKIYKVADAQIAISTGIDALPTAIIEGSAAGLPQITTEIGGIPEIVGFNYEYYVPFHKLESNLRKSMLELPRNIKHIKAPDVSKFNTRDFYNNYVKYIGGDYAKS